MIFLKKMTSKVEKVAYGKSLSSFPQPTMVCLLELGQNIVARFYGPRWTLLRFADTFGYIAWYYFAPTKIATRCLFAFIAYARNILRSGVLYSETRHTFFFSFDPIRFTSLKSSYGWKPSSYLFGFTGTLVILYQSICKTFQSTTK